MEEREEKEWMTLFLNHEDLDHLLGHLPAEDLMVEERGLLE